MARPFWTRTGLASLEALLHFIGAGSGSPGYARRLGARVIQAVEVLDEYPYIGRLVPEFDEGIFRELIFQDYRIVYRMVDGRPWVLVVVHGAMDLRAEMERREISPS